MKLLAFSIFVVTISCLDPKKDGGSQISAPIQETIDHVFDEDGDGSAVKEFFEQVMTTPYRMTMNEMPKQATSRLIPYSGYYYYEKDGGTNQGGALTQYDKAFGTKAVAWEKANHYIAASDPRSKWFGHCNGLAAAASRLPEPPMDIEKNGVMFSRQTIKALLAEIFMSIYEVKLGGQVCKVAAPNPNPFVRKQLDKMDECEDMNPASFLMGLGNVIGGPTRGVLIMDESSNEEIWNFPIYKYTCNNCVNDQWKEVSGKEAEDIIKGGNAGGSAYRFNGNAAKFFDVDLTITFTDGSTTAEVLDRQTPKSKKYRFIIEADGSNKIIGGEWSAANRVDHPDFIWFAANAIKKGDDRRWANPEVDPETVMELWRESWRKSGKPVPYEGPIYPVWNDQWGNYADFTVSIDGVKSGAAFLNKKNTVKIKLMNNQLEGASLAVKINGKDTGSYNVGKEASFDAKFGAGMNRMQLFWSKGETSQQQDLRVVATP